jgi:hypothetical protein
MSTTQNSAYRFTWPDEAVLAEAIAASVYSRIVHYLPSQVAYSVPEMANPFERSFSVR